MSYRYLLAGLSAVWLNFAQADENLVIINQNSVTNLGVKIGKLASVNELPLFNAPAKVMIPSGNEYIVSASQAGIITKLTAAMGDPVKKGDILAEINSPSLLNLQQQFLRAHNDLSVAQAAFQRDKTLYQDGVIAQRRWQETTSQYYSSQSSVNEAKQLLQISGMSTAAVERLAKNHQLGSTLTIHAPLSGIVLERKAVNGEHVDTLAPLFHLADLHELWLEVSVPQERIASIKLGDLVQIENTPIKAAISLIGQSVSLDNQTVLVRAIIKNATAGVFVGQKVNAQILQTITGSAFKAPNTAITQKDGKYFVFVRNERGFQATDINIIGKHADESIITGNLNLNSEIAISGTVALKASWLGLGRDQ
ncbi:MAG: efflux RND transporter periplasmic adaptor subunit [Methylococcaceae bacterium]|jgi:cobalt-zinc-cadmium efflux system membrane fusion protein